MSTVVTTPRKPYIPWWQRLELPAVLPSALLALVMVWSVVQSVASSNWAEGLGVLVGVALPALVVGIVFARMHWLPGWMAHTLSAVLGIAWAVQSVGSLLINEIRGELGADLAARLTSWGDRATEILIRSVLLARTVQAGGRGEDIVLFIVALALLMWALGYSTGWLLFRAGWTWWAVVLNAVVILINYTFASPKPNTLFFIFLGASLLLVVHQHVIHQQRTWQSALIDYPSFMPWRFMLAATLFCGAVVLVTSLLPGNVSSTQVARTWRAISAPLTTMREGWETAFSTINAPPGTAGNGFLTRSMRVGGGRALGDAVVMLVKSGRYDYWRAITRDRYSGRSWENTVGERARTDTNTATAEEARTPLEPGVSALQQLDLQGRELITQTVQLAQSRNDDLVIVGGQFASSSLPVLLEHGFLNGSSGNPIPNYAEMSAVVSQVPLQETQSYTVEALVSVADLQSLRAAGADYPDWVRRTYLQLPDTVTQRTRDQASELVQAANATNAYDQAEAIQAYLRTFTYNEARAMPPENRDWADYFLFDSQNGYCDDFATAMVVMLRSLDVPARIAQGYAGGSLDAQTGSYVVRESVGHTWPEVYFPGYGWQRFEPTPASYANVPIRPAQPESDTDASALSDGSLPIPDYLRDRDLQGLEDDLQLSEADLEASRLALEERQRADQQRDLAATVALLIAIGGLIALGFYQLRRELNGLSPAAAAYLRMGRWAGWAGIRHEQHATPREYGAELAAKLPEQSASVRRIVDAYEAERYNPARDRRGESFDQDLRALRAPLLSRFFANLGGERHLPKRKITTARRNRRR